MNIAYLLIGGNLGDREENLSQARSLIEASCGIVREASAVYETAAWGITDQPDFLNQVLMIETMLSPDELMDRLLAAEQEIGRYRGEKYGPRSIDMDILLFDDIVLDKKHLQIPHPRLAERRFALVPLCELAPQISHPVLGDTILELLSACQDPLPVKKYSTGVDKKR
jgi:2-amino-4-hydroxy-6-hydroxymethyldihydropteridine diphosphokinase